MSSRKFRSIYPLPRGMRNYVLTLREILERITKGNPTIDQLVLWFKNEYNWSDRPTRYSLRDVKKCLGFVQELRGRIKLTTPADKFLRTGDNRLVLDALLRRVSGFEEIISMLAKSQELNLLEIHKRLLKKCDLDWRTTTQTMYRLNWLISLGYVAKDFGKYRLTANGLVTVQEEKK